jgi:predicted nucleic acid-binding protein
MRKLYLDSCCLNRPFDDQTQGRVRREAEAVLLILARILAGEWEWIASEVVRYEIGRTSLPTRRRHIEALLADAHEIVSVGDTEVERGEQLATLGFRDFDALHLACAESGGADVFLTTDDRLLRLASHHAGQLRVRVENPRVWLEEVLTP